MKSNEITIDLITMPDDWRVRDLSNMIVEYNSKRRSPHRWYGGVGYKKLMNEYGTAKTHRYEIK